MNDLHRELAPISAKAWAEIEGEAKSVLKARLAARRLVDFDGPHGWERSALSLGRARRLDHTPAEGVHAAIRQVLPLIELRADFSLSRAELDAIDRGAVDPELEPLIEAAQAIGVAEDRLAFHGYDAGGIRGITNAAEHAALTIPDDYAAFPEVLAEAIGRLQDAGVGGPYGLALGRRAWNGLMTAMDPTGYPVFKRAKTLIEGPMVRAIGVEGAIALSLRGGDFALYVGRDLSVGYAGHTPEHVDLYLVESLTFRPLTPEAAIHLVHSGG